MKRYLLTLFFGFTSYTLSFAQTDPAPNITSKEEMMIVFNKMTNAIKNVKTAKYRLIKNERYNNKIVQSNQIVKQHMDPLKVYMKIIAGPNKGAEILYASGLNNGNAYVNAKSFMPTLNLDPLGILVNDRQRHTIFELGFAYTGDLIHDAYKKYKDRSSEYIAYGGVIKWDNRDVYKFTLDNKEYKIKDYTILPGEDLVKIARKLKLDEYNLLELNPAVSKYTDVKPSQVIKIPESFTKTVIIYIDTKTYLPVYQKMMDLKGVVGEYEYHDLIINPVIPEEEFTAVYSGYSF